MDEGATARPIGLDPAIPDSESGEAVGLPAARLTLTFGFGGGLFVSDGKDRYGLSAQQPMAFVDQAAFNGDQLIEVRTGGGLSVRACADDPQVAFHTVRQLARLTYGTAIMRWAQAGYLSRPDTGATPRNPMGFKDGTRNPAVADAAAIANSSRSATKGPIE